MRRALDDRLSGGSSRLIPQDHPVSNCPFFTPLKAGQTGLVMTIIPGEELTSFMLRVAYEQSEQSPAFVGVYLELELIHDPLYDRQAP